MTTVVLGAGVIGVTTAYFLARSGEGEEVTVIDRQLGAGLETSFRQRRAGDARDV